MRLLAAIGAFVVSFFLFNIVIDARTAAILGCIVAIIVFFGLGNRVRRL